MKKGIMISQIEPESRKLEGETLKVIEKATADAFFQTLQTVEIPYPRERKEAARVINERSLELTYCLARVLNEAGGNLSSLDDSVREHSVNTVLSELDAAKEAGAARLVVISGSAPKEADRREEALKALYASLVTLAREMTKREAPFPVVIEPLDAFAHKKNTLGLVREAVDLVKGVNSEVGHDRYSLCLDTAHMLLNGEDIYNYSGIERGIVSEFHFCNPVLQKNNVHYGDNHILFGEPGALDGKDVPAIYKSLKAGLDTEEMGIFFEIKQPAGWNFEKMIDYNRELFQYL